MGWLCGACEGVFYADGVLILRDVRDGGWVY